MARGGTPFSDSRYFWDTISLPTILELLGFSVMDDITEHQSSCFWYINYVHTIHRLSEQDITFINVMCAVLLGCVEI